MAHRTLVPTTEALEDLLGVLCVECGFCFHGDEYDLLVDTPPPDAASFTAAVFATSGMDSSKVDTELYHQVHSRVVRAFDRSGAV